MQYSNKNNEIKFSLVRPLPHELFDREALKVYYRLRRFDFISHFVGGCVRDLLLGKTPKDFDLVTEARPHQIRNIFRNSRIIGRRFRLVNVLFGQKIIEVATFRKTPWKNGLPSDDNNLLIKNDNYFGTDEEDAMRRDFTINALFYAPDERTVVDYVDGLEDLKRGKIRTIGPSKIRFAEDPVRIIRALKFRGQLGFDLVPEVEQAVCDCSHYLKDSPPARLLLEMLKILRGRHPFLCFKYLADTEILSIIVPDFAKMWKDDECGGNLLKKYLKALDKLNHYERSRLSDSALLTIPCWAILKNTRRRKNQLSQTFFDTRMHNLTEDLLLSKRMRQNIREIIVLQKPLEKKSRAINSGVQNLPDALGILKLRALMGDVSQNTYHFWKNKLAPVK